MIEAICIDNSNKPSDLPTSKWLEEGKIYHIIYATIVLPQRVLAFQLHEIDLDDSCFPYQYFSANRFIIKSIDIEALEELIMNSSEADSMVSNLLT